jgi:hypothetical protein
MSTARIERAACCLGGNRSILLSYVNESGNCNIFSLLWEFRGEDENFFICNMEGVPPVDITIQMKYKPCRNFEKPLCFGKFLILRGPFCETL